MKVVHLSTTAFAGGAARAAVRLHHALLDAGADSTMVVHHRDLDEPRIVEPPAPFGVLSRRAPHAIDLAALALLRDGRQRSPMIAGRRVAPFVRSLRPDVVHLHWVQAGFLRPEAIAGLGAPVVWTLHDCWPFSGAAHYPVELDALDAWLVRRKRRAYARVPSLRAIAPSHWIGEMARKSPLFAGRAVDVIPNAVDPDRFKPQPKTQARLALGLDPAARYVLFSAASLADPRKGLASLGEALRGVDARLLLAGKGDAPVDGIRLGYVTDEAKLAAIIAAADVVACPSAAENLSNAALEALACGRPVVAFDVGGMRDIVDHQQTGWLAPEGDVASLREGLRWALEHGDGERPRRTAVARWSPPVIAARHLALYGEAIR